MRSPTVAITGGFGALGQAAAAGFARDGWNVALIDRAREQNGGREVTMLGIGGVDLEDPAGARSALQQVKTAFGSVEALVNAAGGFTYAPLDTSYDRVVDGMHRANLVTCLNSSLAARELLSPGGSIVNVGAFAALKGAAGMAAYAATKSGVMRLTKSLADELGGVIRCNAILPSILDTPANRAAMPDADPARWTSLAAAAEVIVFLASDRSRAINGALIPVTNAVAR